MKTRNKMHSKQTKTTRMAMGNREAKTIKQMTLNKPKLKITMVKMALQITVMETKVAKDNSKKINTMRFCIKVCLVSIQI